MSTLAATLPDSNRNAGIDILLAAIWAGEAAILMRSGNPFLTWALVGGGLLVAAHFWQAAQGQRSDRNLVIAACAPVFMMISGSGLGLTTRLAGGRLFDGQLAAVDHGIAPAIWHWCQARAWAIDPLTIGYDALPLAMMLAVACAGARRWHLVRAAMIGGLLVLPWYLILPAVGPAHVGQRGAAPNCMPSMHLTWALLIFTNSTGRAKWAAGAFVALTALATLATGEHYTPDLVAALPWTWALNRIAERRAA